MSPYEIFIQMINEIKNHFIRLSDNDIGNSEQNYLLAQIN